MSFVLGLQCRECGHDYAAPKNLISRETIACRDKNLWRYRELVPIDGEPRAGLYSGFTPLVRAQRLAQALGIKELYITDDSVNHPTFSYKDIIVSFFCFWFWDSRRRRASLAWHPAKVYKNKLTRNLLRRPEYGSASTSSYAVA